MSSAPAADWLRLDSRLPLHPKVAPLSDRAFRLYIESLCYSKLGRTDGLVPAATKPTVKAADELVQAGLWEPTKTGDWHIHDFLEWQESAEQIAERSRARAEAGRRGGLKKAENAASKASKRPSKPLADGLAKPLQELGDLLGENGSSKPSKPLADVDVDKDVTSGNSSVVTNTDTVPMSTTLGQTAFDRQRNGQGNAAKTSPGTAGKFAEFWSVYPRKEAKIDAEKAFGFALKKADFDAIVSGAKRYRDDPNREPQFTAHPGAWLRDGRWEDQPLPPRSGNGKGKLDSEVEVHLARAAAVRAQKGN